jgi:hypothetical protein
MSDTKCSNHAYSFDKLRDDNAQGFHQGHWAQIGTFGPFTQTCLLLHLCLVLFKNLNT